MQTLAVPLRARTEAPQFQRIKEVPINYTGHETTLVVKNGFVQCRVMIGVAISGAELGMFCRNVKGWNFSGHGLRVTVPDHTVPTGRRIDEYGPADVAAARILPTTIQVEWPSIAPEKG